MGDEPSAGRKAAEDGSFATLSQFVAKILEQLSLSAWLPAAVFAATFTVEYQFRYPEVHELGDALSRITRDVGTFLLLVIPVMVLTTMITQAFSYGSIRVLEGYWIRPSPLRLVRSMQVKRQAERFEKLQVRRKEAAIQAFAWARPILLHKNVPMEVINNLELEAATGRRRPLEEGPTKDTYGQIRWWTYCRPWEVVKVEQLDIQLADYTASSARKLPTRLGNVQRRYEDALQNPGSDLRTFVMRNKQLVSASVQLQHDQFRARLDMYCTLVFVSIACVGTTLALLTTKVSGWTLVIVCAAFAIFGWIAYLSAIASAHGYGATLQVMDDAASQPNAS
ncbi:hypothetical protein [Humibacillus xanthopallidus]|uniref:hypothetical protein n=1 Tax=Humibacillus xanthopallidus TaxID=412689 RepID=UPI0011516792|nr:hypothetical protein [Humibacillus xanthopallidus]